MTDSSDFYLENEQKLKELQEKSDKIRQFLIDTGYGSLRTYPGMYLMMNKMEMDLVHSAVEFNQLLYALLDSLN